MPLQVNVIYLEFLPYQVPCLENPSLTLVSHLKMKSSNVTPIAWSRAFRKHLVFPKGVQKERTSLFGMNNLRQRARNVQN